MLVSAAWQTLSPIRMGLVRTAADAALVRKLRLVAPVSLLLQLSILCDIICALSFPSGDRLAHECSAVDVGDQAYAIIHAGSRKKEMVMKAAPRNLLRGSARRRQYIFSVAGGCGTLPKNHSLESY